jgi:hypothetical protein
MEEIVKPVLLPMMISDFIRRKDSQTAIVLQDDILTQCMERMLAIKTQSVQLDMPVVR